jgi:hypothetical protein
MPHVLLLNSDRLEVLERLARRPDLAVSAIVKPKYAGLYRGQAEVECVSDVADVSQVLRAAIALMRAHGPFDAILAPLERSIIPAAFLRSYLQVQGMGLQTALGFANKVVMKTRLAAAGVPLARFQPVSSLRAAADSGVGWPLILKPAVGAGTQHTYRFSSPAELREFAGTGAGGEVDALGVPLLVEAEVEMTAELHYDAVISAGQVIRGSASQYFRPLLRDFGGFIGSATLAAEQGQKGEQADGRELRELHERVVAVLGLRDGVTHLEAFSTESGLVFGEVTCRPGGGGVPTVISDHGGWDIWDDFLLTGLGQTPSELEMSSSTEVFGWCGLPARNGRVERISTTEQLEAIEGVSRVQLDYGPGDLIQDKATSVFNAGIAYLRCDSPKAVDAAVQQLRERWTLDLAPADR